MRLADEQGVSTVGMTGMEVAAMMFRPVGAHAEKGCLFSSKPEVIVMQEAHNNEHGNESGRESKLASSIYFKRCDGSFKNMKGERLAMTTRDAAA